MKEKHTDVDRWFVAVLIAAPLMFAAQTTRRHSGARCSAHERSRRHFRPGACETIRASRPFAPARAGLACATRRPRRGAPARRTRSLTPPAVAQADRQVSGRAVIPNPDAGLGHAPPPTTLTE